jgi:hypothetical protein
MTNKLEFDIPSDKKVSLVVIAIIVVSIVDVILFGSLIEVEVVPFGRLAILDRVLLAAPFWGLLWFIFAGLGRKHTAGYYFRYRYGQTLSFLLFFTATSLGTNTLFRQFDPTSFGSALGNYYAILFIMFIIWGLIVSVVAIPIILWRSKRISARSVSKTPVASKKVDTAKRSSQQISQSSNVVKAKPDQPAVEAAQTVKTETKPAQDTPTKKRLPERKQESIDDSADELYAIAWDEVEANNTDKGLWARLYVKHDADEAKTKVSYLEERVKILIQQREVELQAAKRLEKERQEKEKKRLEEERLEEERLEKKRLEEEWLEEVRLKNKRLEEERLEEERLEKKRLEEERLEKERLEKKRLEEERLEKERLEKKRLEEERLEKERLEKKRLDRPRQERIQQENRRREVEEKEERELLQRLHEQSPIPLISALNEYFMLKEAVLDSDLPRILLLLVSGANPKRMLDDPDDRIRKALSSSGNKEMRDILVIATRLWEKGSRLGQID